MTSGKIRAGEFFKNIEAPAHPRSAGIADTVVRFVLDGTEEEAIHCIIRQGKATVHTGYHDVPDVVIRTTLNEWTRLTLGKVGPFRAYLSGDVEVKGDVVPAQRILKFFKSAIPPDQGGRTEIPDDDLFEPGMAGFVWDLSSDVIRKSYE